MSFVEINWRPSEKQLKQFGFVCAFALPTITWLWGGGQKWVLALAIVGAVLAVLGGIVPIVLRPIFISLSLITAPLGIVIGEIAMMLIFYGLFFPIGLVMKLLGRDALQLRRGSEDQTYWRAKKQASDAASYYRQS